MQTEQIHVEVAYALPQRQLILDFDADAGITVKQAIIDSGILAEFLEIDLETVKVGVFGKLAKMDAVLNNGDRVEIYRPLIADPKEARKKRAAEGKKLTNRAKAAPTGAEKGA
ncbi:RnfH family protein [Solemya elarraichensis gill symbiont]|uniref:UPF0125 protein BOW52_03895 n=1 Tax=Solemya elarraichensis gill symbiont TaxID=1918949 RepID=A0A1T2LA63_9GAMM|nr:RnfH family protein [Solemya elarraichensis gill symbiont]OOZ41981.1 RnfH family protein [Solemya elarraichensis gill symbiont]